MSVVVRSTPTVKFATQLHSFPNCTPDVTQVPGGSDLNEVAHASTCISSGIIAERRVIDNHDLKNKLVHVLHFHLSLASSFTSGWTDITVNTSTNTSHVQKSAPSSDCTPTRALPAKEA